MQSTTNTTTKSGKKDPQTLRAKVVHLWTKANLNVTTLLGMVKFALGPTIAIAIFQDNGVAEYFGPSGYILAVAVLLSNVLAPRATFLEAMLVNVVSVCLTAAVLLLATWTAVRARENTTPSGQPLGGYNSSASAVCGVWLFFLVYIINSFKAARPQYRFAGVLSTIFAVVGMIYGAQFTTTTTGSNPAFIFVRRFLETLLSGLGIGTAVSLFFKPTNCRTPVLNGLREYFRGIAKVVDASKLYFQNLETESPFENNEQADNLRKEIRTVRTINTKLTTDIRAAKKEIAYGMLDADDFVEIHRLGRPIFLPIAGMMTVPDIFERVAKNAGWTQSDPESYVKTYPDAPNLNQEQMEQEYRTIMRCIREPMEDISTVIAEAVEHVLIRLGLEKRGLGKIVKETDEEAKPDNTLVGKDGFADYLEERVKRFRYSRQKVLREWCEMHRIPLPSESFKTDWEWPKGVSDSDNTHRQRQLFVLLHIEHLLWTSSHSFVLFVRWCDEKAAKGMKNHLVHPTAQRVKKWILNLGRFADPADDDDGMADMSDIIYGEAFKSRRDPERLPAKTSWQRFGASFRRIPTLLRSPHSLFGFRIACAIMSIAIMAYLHDTQHFFIRQRLFWAAILATVSMTRTSGQATWIYFLRFMGSALAVVLSYVVWYIVNGETPGVIVLLFLAIMAYGWIVVVHPRFLLAGIIAAVTTTIIVGYELQVRELGIEVATSNGQDFYPLYLLAPIRLATVSAGLFVAFVFTVLPFPVTERSELRKDVGTALMLSAHHYAVIQETINARARGDDGDLYVKTSPGRRLQKERMRVLTKIMILVERMHVESAMIKWQFPIDGYFPKKAYDRIIETVDKIIVYSALMGHASESFSMTEPNGATHTPWFACFRQLLADPHLQIPSHSVTSTLFLLSSSMINAQPMPPHPPLPAEYDLSNHLQELDPHIMAIRHVAEPGYSSFATMQIASRSLIADLHALTSMVKGLVGELDFSYRYKHKGNKSA